MPEKISASYIFDQMVPKILSEQPDVARKVNTVLGIELFGDNGGYWTLDLTKYPSIEKGKTKEPKCTLSAHATDFEDLLADSSVRNFLEAFKQKRIQATGHLPTILKLERLFMSLTRSKE